MTTRRLQLSHGVALNRIALALLVLQIPVFSSGQDDPPTEQNWSITADCELLVVPQKLALSIITQLEDDATFQRAWDSLQTRIASGELTQPTRLHVRGSSNDYIKAASHEGFVYVQEYDRPPRFPNDLPKPELIELIKAWPSPILTPLEFTTTNLGVGFTAGVMVAPESSWVYAEVSLEHSRLLRMDKCQLGALPTGQPLEMELPVFYRANSYFELQMRTRRWMLVAVHQLPEQDYELSFLKFTVEKTGAPAPPAEPRGNHAIRTDVKTIALRRETALPLIAAFSKDEKAAAAAETHLLDMITRDEAELLDWSLAWCNQQSEVTWNAKAKTENLQDITAPAEFRVFRFGHDFRRPTFSDEPPYPVSYQTSQAGQTFSAEGKVLRDGAIIELDTETTFSQFDGVRRMARAASPYVFPQPEFSSVHSQLTSYLKAGVPTLLHVATLPEPNPRIVLTVVRGIVYRRGELLNATPADGASPLVP